MQRLRIKPGSFGLAKRVNRPVVVTDLHLGLREVVPERGVCDFLQGLFEIANRVTRPVEIKSYDSPRIEQIGKRPP